MPMPSFSLVKFQLRPIIKVNINVSQINPGKIEFTFGVDISNAKENIKIIDNPKTAIDNIESLFRNSWFNSFIIKVDNGEAKLVYYLQGSIF